MIPCIYSQNHDAGKLTSAIPKNPFSFLKKYAGPPGKTKLFLVKNRLQTLRQPGNGPSDYRDRNCQ
jgi:hypothetical protein